MRMMKKRGSVLYSLLLALLLTGCQSYKKVPYLQNVEEIRAEAVKMYDARIMPKDLLSIVVSASEPELAVPFNLTAATTTSINLRTATAQPALQNYLVNNDGYIDFPVLGEIKLGGLTKNEAEDAIRERLKEYLTERPIVTVRMVNYKISVLGEVSRPNTFTIANEKVNVFEALAMAGDMTIYGRRDNVKLVREHIDGQPQVFEFNMNDPNIVYAPYYYLQQNDILYVTPNKTKSKTADISTSTTIWLSITTTLVSIASLLYNILK